MTHSSSCTRHLTVVGDPNDINTWSNIPYFFLQAGKRRGFLDGGLPLKPEKLQVHRWGWNLWTLLRTWDYGGFQYSPYFLDQLWEQVETDPVTDEFISHFPLLPPKPAKRHYRVSYYIDATLTQNFDDYDVAANVSPPVREQALAQERRNYHHADRVVGMSGWAAQSVIEDYDVPEEKVHVVPGGANLREDELPDTVESAAPSDLQPLRLGFIGKNWRRKGLPFLLDVADALEQRSLEVEVWAVGPEPSALPDHPALRPQGFIDKASDLGQFVTVVRSVHFGCLFSSIEAFGISNVECLRLGVPVLATNVGGIPDTVPDSCGLLFAPDTAAGMVAERLATFVENPSMYHELREHILSQAKRFTWDRTVKRFVEIWAEED
ncbi:glycosyltransferase involved in cell wall biosynthesis [Salinibacter ruber]|uniref:glycosyltransferase family 4 protein n=1 Tax=Salinibacter ruber TaxID=146919 RepID=UPI0021683C4F|nr:glycosyltransferase family 4 protein [Salinibacter ruber]MCS3937084.1 glycosyltransferase involved in cell wall biosynthesis [Salinibacter ruber]